MNKSPFLGVISRLLMASLALAFLAGCGAMGGGREESTLTVGDFQESVDDQNRADQLNESLLALAVEHSGAEDLTVYRLGTDDRLKIEVFNVPELDQEVRVDGNGRIPLALIGDVDVLGMTLADAEELIADQYADGYIRRPQVNIQVTEFRSQQFTVIGAVVNPRVYAVSRQTSLIEALAMGGGLTDEAGDVIHLNDRVHDPETNELKTRTYVVPVEELMDDPAKMNVNLGANATINVPRAGSIFVEGMVGRPGVYTMQPNTTILQAIAMAGGMTYEASNSGIKVVRRSGKEWEEQYHKLADLRRGPEYDEVLNAGDVVVVERSGSKTFLREASRWVWLFAIGI